MYRAHYGFLAGAVALTVITVLVVLATLNGFWRLGRAVSLSPVEIAKAFGAPLLVSEHSNAKADELVKSAGTMPVQYVLTARGEQMAADKQGSEVEVLKVDRPAMHLEFVRLQGGS